MEHLHSLGHTRIDCVNTQPMDCVIQQRIEQWQRWCERHKITGRLWNRPVASYQSALPQAYHLMCDVLDDSSFNATAVVCMTMEVARATTAVIQKRGLVVGQDISVCTIGGEDEAAYCYPSITNTEPSDATQIIQACLDWMINDAHVGKPVQINKSREMILVPRDSTGPCPLK
jgi:DNA-binding LacI/PurR family transcriptional regulator